MRRILRIALRFECSSGLDHSRWRDHNVGSWYWSLFNSNGIHIYIYTHTYHPSIPYIYIYTVYRFRASLDHWIILGQNCCQLFSFFSLLNVGYTCWVSAASMVASVTWQWLSDLAGGLWGAEVGRRKSHRFWWYLHPSGVGVIGVMIPGGFFPWVFREFFSSKSSLVDENCWIPDVSSISRGYRCSFAELDAYSSYLSLELNRFSCEQTVGKQMVVIDVFVFFHPCNVIACNLKVGCCTVSHVRGLDTKWIWTCSSFPAKSIVIANESPKKMQSKLSLYISRDLLVQLFEKTNNKLQLKQLRWRCLFNATLYTYIYIHY